MPNFVLKKGTLVRHGTSLQRLRVIVEQGLQPGSERNDARSGIELAPETRGIYVGTLSAYFGAYAAYSAEVAPYWTAPQMMNAALCAAMNPRKLREIEGLPEAPNTLPVVINIVLQEDRALLADEDFVCDGALPLGREVPRHLLEAEAEPVWQRWGSGVLTDAIPASWFHSIEHPRLTNLDGALDMHKQTWADCMLFAGSLLQTSNKELPAPLIEQYEAEYGVLALSQKIGPSSSAVRALLAHKSLAHNASRWFNHFRFVQLMDEMAKQYGIRTAQFGDRPAVPG